MTAPLQSTSTLLNGVVQLSQVTNTFAGYIQSGGVAYNLVTPWQADKLEWYNYTKFGTNDKNCQGVWFRDFPAGDALIIARGTTTLTSTLETTNGVTMANTTGGFTDQHLTITGITAATASVTITSHGLSNNDRIYITKVVGTIASSVNNKEYVIRVTDANTIVLYDVYGVLAVLSGTYTSGGQATKEGPELGIVNVPKSYILTLGTAVMGDDNDKIYFVATQFNNYQNYGDVA